MFFFIHPAFIFANPESDSNFLLYNPQTIPSDTESLIKQKGLPDIQLNVTQENENSDKLLLYKHEDDSSGIIYDEVYYLDEELGITHKIKDVEKNKDSSDSESWVKETINDLKESIELLKKRKEAMDKQVAGLPGFNYFDRVELLDDEMTLGFGKGKNSNKTTLTFDPGENQFNLIFQVPIQ